MGIRAATYGSANGGDGERSGLDSRSDSEPKSWLSRSSEAYSREDRDPTLCDYEYKGGEWVLCYCRESGPTRLRLGERTRLGSGLRIGTTRWLISISSISTS